MTDCEMEENNSMQHEIDATFDSDEIYSDERPGTPVEIIETAAEASADLLPAKSKGRYQKVYDNFQKWKSVKKATSNSERVVLSYLSELEKSNKKPTILWATYSMLKSTLKLYDKIDIEKYSSVTAMLKKFSHGYVPKKALTFTEEEVQDFLDNAPDVIWLDVKV